MNAARLDDAERELHEVHSRGNHTLSWNRRVGKSIGRSNEGLITCRATGRKSILSKTVCSGHALPAEIPLEKKDPPSKCSEPQ